MSIHFPADQTQRMHRTMAPTNGVVTKTVSSTLLLAPASLEVLLALVTMSLPSATRKLPQTPNTLRSSTRTVMTCPRVPNALPQTIPQGTAQALSETEMEVRLGAQRMALPDRVSSTQIPSFERKHSTFWLFADSEKLFQTI